MEKSFCYNLNQLVNTEVIGETQSIRLKYIPENKNKTIWDKLFKEETQEGVYDYALLSLNYVCRPDQLGKPDAPGVGKDYTWKEYLGDIYRKPSIKLTFTVGSFTRTFDTIEEAREYENWITNETGFVRLTFHGNEWKNLQRFGEHGQLELKFK